MPAASRLRRYVEVEHAALVRYQDRAFGLENFPRRTRFARRDLETSAAGGAKRLRSRGAGDRRVDIGREHVDYSAVGGMSQFPDRTTRPAGAAVIGVPVENVAVQTSPLARFEPVMLVKSEPLGDQGSGM